MFGNRNKDLLQAAVVSADAARNRDIAEREGHAYPLTLNKHAGGYAGSLCRWLGPANPQKPDGFQFVELDNGVRLQVFRMALPKTLSEPK
jgi:hypothetical protein